MFLLHAALYCHQHIPSPHPPPLRPPAPHKPRFCESGMIIPDPDLCRISDPGSINNKRGEEKGYLSYLFL
jgi:hypothetical protein